MFARREIAKTYAAIVWGPSAAAGREDRRRDRTQPPRPDQDDGRRPRRAARRRRSTDTRESFRGATLLEIDLVTGRTHQIRVHFAARHHPVLGDTRYGGAPWKRLRDPERRAIFSSFPRLALHAARLELRPSRLGEADLASTLPSRTTWWRWRDALRSAREREAATSSPSSARAASRARWRYALPAPAGVRVVDRRPPPAGRLRLARGMRG